MCDCVTDVSVHGGSEAHCLFLTAVYGLLQRVDHLLVGVNFVVEEHAVVGVCSFTACVHRHTQFQNSTFGLNC